MQLRNTDVFKSLIYSGPLSPTKLLKLWMKNKLSDHNSSMCARGVEEETQRGNSK